MTYYALKGPTGIVGHTVRDSRDDVWFEVGFDYVAFQLGEDWKNGFWKRPGPSRISAAYHGYRIVPVRVVECRRAKEGRA